MSVYSITNRYAKALLTQAESSQQFEVVGNDMQLVFDTLKGSKDLKVALESPVISDAKKKDILSEIFSSQISKESVNFLNFVVTKNREEILFEITKRFLELRDAKLNIINAAVVTAVDISSKEKEMFKKSLEDYSKKKVRISFSVDESIIGGFLVQLHDKMLDASILHQLDALKKRLVKSDQSLVN